MKLLNFRMDGDVQLGLVEGGRVFDVTAAAQGDAAFASVVALIRAGRQASLRTKAILEKNRANPALWRLLENLKHAPLIPLECRIFAVGLNYADHAAENRLPPPPSPIFFEKLASGVTPHNEPILLPSCTNEVDYEAEFAFMIGEQARRVQESDVARCIAGYTIMNDVTARDLQMQDKQWFRGKNCDGFAPLGPWLVTADEIPNRDNLEITLRLNGCVRQHSNTSQLIFKPPALIAYLSQTLTLEPGDVISTGTPGGIGYYANPPVFLRPGDIMEVEVASIGTLRNPVVAAKE